MAESPLQTSVPLRASPVSLFLTPTLDRLAAFVALLPLSLYMLYLAWRIRRDSPCPALFKQTRAGHACRTSGKAAPKQVAALK